MITPPGSKPTVCKTPRRKELVFAGGGVVDFWHLGGLEGGFF